MERRKESIKQKRLRWRPRATVEKYAMPSSMPDLGVDPAVQIQAIKTATAMGRLTFQLGEKLISRGWQLGPPPLEHINSPLNDHTSKVVRKTCRMLRRTRSEVPGI